MTLIQARPKGAAGFMSGMRALLLPRRSIVIAMIMAFLHLSGVALSWSMVAFVLWWQWLRDLARWYCDGQAALIPGLGREVGYAWSLATMVAIVCFMLDARSPSGIRWHEFDQKLTWLAVFTVVLLCTLGELLATIGVLVIALIGALFLRFQMDIDVRAWMPADDAAGARPALYLFTSALMVLAWRLWRRMRTMRWESGMSGAYPMILTVFPSSSVEEDAPRTTSWYARLHGLRFGVPVKTTHSLRLAYTVGLFALWAAEPSPSTLIFVALFFLPDVVLQTISMVKLKQVVTDDEPTSELLATLPASASPGDWRTLALKLSPSDVGWIKVLLVMLGMPVLLLLIFALLDLLRW